MALPLVKQTHIVTSDLNKKLMYDSLHEQIEDRIFKDLINGELSGVKVTFIVETLKTDEDVDRA